jgi:hypothetical protein
MSFDLLPDIVLRLDDDVLKAHVTACDTRLRAAAGQAPRDAANATDLEPWEGEGLLMKLRGLAPNLHCLTLNGNCVGQEHQFAEGARKSSLTAATLDSLLHFRKLRELTLSIVQVIDCQHFHRSCHRFPTVLSSLTSSSPLSPLPPSSPLLPCVAGARGAVATLTRWPATAGNAVYHQRASRRGRHHVAIAFSPVAIP